MLSHKTRCPYSGQFTNCPNINGLACPEQSDNSAQLAFDAAARFSAAARSLALVAFVTGAEGGRLKAASRILDLLASDGGARFNAAARSLALVASEVGGRRGRLSAASRILDSVASDMGALFDDATRDLTLVTSEDWRGRRLFGGTTGSSLLATVSVVSDPSKPCARSRR